MTSGMDCPSRCSCLQIDSAVIMSPALYRRCARANWARASIFFSRAEGAELFSREPETGSIVLVESDGRFAAVALPLVSGRAVKALGRLVRFRMTALGSKIRSLARLVLPGFSLSTLSTSLLLKLCFPAAETRLE